MKRLVRRVLGVVIGLTLGWYAAGVAQQSVGPWENASYAEETIHSENKQPTYADHDDHRDAVEGHHDAGGGHQEHATGGHDAGHGAGHGGGGHDDAGMITAKLLMPRTFEQVCWYRSVLFTAGGLFIGAVVLGYPALALRGPEPPDPAAAHDDHGHDDHGHGH